MSEAGMSGLVVSTQANVVYFTGLRFDRCGPPAPDP